MKNETRIEKLNRIFSEAENLLDEFRVQIHYFSMARQQFEMTGQAIKLDTGNLEIF